MPLTLRKRPNSPFWYVRGTVRGRKVFESTKTTSRTEAEAYRVRLESDLTFSTDPDRPRLFFEAVESYVKAGGKPDFLYRLVEVLGKTPLKSITPHVISETVKITHPYWIDQRGKKREYKQASLNRLYFTPLAAVLHHAAELGWIPYVRVKKRRVQKTPPQWAEIEWFEALWAVCNDDLRKITTFLVYTGCRVTEVLNLTWDRVDLEAGWAYVPITKNGDHKTVYLPEAVIEALGTPGKGRVFSYASKDTVNQGLKWACKKAGIQYLSTHKLGRHTYATWMRRYGKLDQTGMLATQQWRDPNSILRYMHADVSEEQKKSDLLPRAKNVHKKRKPLKKK